MSAIAVPFEVRLPFQLCPKKAIRLHRSSAPFLLHTTEKQGL
jgi:hypothetical protein